MGVIRNIAKMGKGKKGKKNVATQAVKSVATAAFIIIKLITFFVGLMSNILLVLAIVITIVIVDFLTELGSAKNTPAKIYAMLDVTDVKNLVTIKENDGEYYWDFIDNYEENIKKIVKKSNSTAGLQNLPKSEGTDFLKQIIKAELITQLPDLGGDVPNDSENGFQGSVKIRRVTPNKEIGSVENPGRGEVVTLEEDNAVNDVNPVDYENIVNKWPAGKNLTMSHRAYIYKQSETDETIWDPQYTDSSKKTYLQFEKNDKVTYTGNYKTTKNEVSNASMTYVEIKNDTQTGYVKITNLEDESEKSTSDTTTSKPKTSTVTTSVKATKTAADASREYVIAIAAGHNFVEGIGGNTGAHYEDLKEEELTLEVAEKVEELFKEYKNVKVVQTGTTSDNKTGVKVKDRTKLARDANPDLCIQIHVDAGGGSGVTTIYKDGDGYSQQLAEVLAETISGSMGLQNRGAGPDTEKAALRNLGIIENYALTNFPSIVTEGGFIDGDYALLKSKDGLNNYAKGIVEGIVKYLGMEHVGYTSTVKTGATETSSIESKVTNMKYVTEEKLNQLVDGNDEEALNVFTLDSENKLVTTKAGKTEDKGIEISKNATMDLSTALGKYAIPYEYLLYFYIDTKESKFSLDLANEVIDNSELVIAVQDEITTTQTTETKQTWTNASGKYAPEDETKNNDVIKSDKQSPVSTETWNTKVGLTYVNTWCVKAYQKNNYSTEILNMGKEDEKVINIVGTVSDTTSTSVSETTSTAEEKTIKVRDKDGKEKEEKYTLTTSKNTIADTEVLITKYETGDFVTKGNENKFLDLFKKDKVNGPLREAYLMQILAKNEKTANLIELTQYLIYQATEIDTGNVDFDYNIYSLQTFNNVDYGGADGILLAYLKAWEGHEGLSADGTKYKIGGVKGNRTVGYGVDLETSGADSILKAMGYSTALGDYIDVSVVDEISKNELNSRKQNIVAKTAGCQPPLSESQLDALTCVSYQYGNIGNFVEKYAAYGNIDQLRNTVQAYKSGGGLNANGYYFTTEIGGNPEGNGRCNANWKLFHEGIYTDQSGNVIQVAAVSTEVLKYAESKLGCPYVWGATGPSTFDCSGLTQWCYKQTGVNIPRTSGEQKAGALQVLSVSEAQPGDILWRDGHVALFVSNEGDGKYKYIHAPHTGDVVKYSTGTISGNTFTNALRYK